MLQAQGVYSFDASRMILFVFKNQVSCFKNEKEVNFAHLSPVKDVLGRPPDACMLWSERVCIKWNNRDPCALVKAKKLSWK